MIREVLDLKYEGAPPISIVTPKFKDKPKLPFKPRGWEQTPFRNSARKDELILHHWIRKGDVGSIGAALPVTPADSNAASEMETDDKPTNPLPDSKFARYNLKVEKPQYTDEQYETHLKSNDWTRAETDYLIDLAYEFDLRWMIIADRYEYQPSESSNANADSTMVTAPQKARIQEDIKARYYDVAAKTMVLHNPLSSMSSSEFDAHEKMIKFNPARETQRKKYAEQLMQRTEEERYEEEMLLNELSRIVSNQEKLFNERKALYDRLEPATSVSRENFSTSMYQSSQGLAQLMQNLMTQSKNKEMEKKEKRRSAIEAGELQNGQEMRQRGNGPDKRASTGGESGRRQFSAREEAKYGISHPNDRLTSGVQFRGERVAKASQAKSAVQTSRISAALTELGIPPRLLMPTAKVVTEYENLIEKIKILLDVRKVSEKLDGEIKVWQMQKGQQEAKDRGEEVKEEHVSPAGNAAEEDGEEDEPSKVEPDVNDEDDTKADVPEIAPSEDEEDDDEDNDDSDAEAEAQEDSDKDSDAEASDEADEDAEAEEDEDRDVDANGNEDDNDVAIESRKTQPDEDEEEPEHEQDEPDGEDENEDEVDEAMVDAISPEAPASPMPVTRSEGARKRSASVISHVSNRSSKRQKK